MMAGLFAIYCLLIINIDAATDNKLRGAVNHIRGALLYGVASCVVPYFILGSNIAWWHFIALPVLTRAAFFDIIINEKMNVDWLYEGDVTKDKSKFSFIDTVEKWTGLSVFFLRILYIALYTGYLLYYLISEI